MYQYLRTNEAVANFSGAMDVKTILINGRSSKSHTSRRNIIKYLLIATLAFSGCDKPNTVDGPDNSGDGNGDGNGNGNEPKVVIDARSDKSVENLIYNYVMNTCIKHNHETDEEVMACVNKYMKKTLYLESKDTISDKLAHVSVNVGKIGNPKTFDRATPYVKVISGDCTEREGVMKVETPYDPSSRTFRYEYNTSCKEEK